MPTLGARSRRNGNRRNSLAAVRTLVAPIVPMNAEAAQIGRGHGPQTALAVA